MSAIRPHVLLVDDNADTRFLIARAVRCSGLDVTLSSVADADEALARLAGSAPYGDRERHPPPDLVLLDWKLPGRPSHEVLRWMRRHPVFARLPVVVLTTSHEEEDRRDALAAGADAFVSKPGPSADLTALIQSTLIQWLPTLAAAAPSRLHEPHVPSDP